MEPPPDTPLGDAHGAPPQALDHRPWPAPGRRWNMAMVWHDLAFLHWPVAPQVLREQIPAGLSLDTFDGAAWLGVVPFRMSGVRPRGVPPLPGISAFPEINLRTYVTAGGKPGVWFFSLDVPHRLPVFVARRLFHLPYFLARMRVESRDDALHYTSLRRPTTAPEFSATYRPAGPVALAEPGSLEAWLTERYCLYAANRRGHLFRGDIHHAPWPLQPAEVEVATNTFAQSIGLPAFQGPPLAHFARRLDVVAWTIERVPGP